MRGIEVELTSDPVFPVLPSAGLCQRCAIALHENYLFPCCVKRFSLNKIFVFLLLLLKDTYFGN